MSTADLEIWVMELDKENDFVEIVVDAPGTHNSPTKLPISPTVFHFSGADLGDAFPDLAAAVASKDPLLRFPLSLSRQSEETFGDALFNQLIRKHDALHEVWAIFIAQERRRLRLCLAEKAGAWPWETLHDDRTGGFLARRNISIARYVKMEPPLEPLHFDNKEPLRMLVVFGEDLSQSAAGKTEEDAIKRALGDSLGQDIEIELIKPQHEGGVTTLEQIRKTVKGKQYHILHYFGHGSSSQQGLLRLASGHQEAVDPFWVKGRDLIDALDQTQQNLRLVILNACELAQPTQEAISGQLPYTNLPTAFLQAGSAMVIAMQYPIRQETASKFTEAFYGYLGPRLFSRAFEIEEAVVTARRAIAISANSVEWITPVVFTRLADDVIFDIPKERLDKYAEKREMQKLLREIEEDCNAERWADAAQKLVQLLKKDPTSSEGEKWKDKLFNKSTELMLNRDPKGRQIRNILRP
jgi:hypothetical protein